MRLARAKIGLMASNELRRTFDAGRRKIRVRLLMWASVLVWGAGMGTMAWSTFQNMTLSEEEGGGLAPFGQRLGMALFIGALALAFPVAMHVYGRCYVSRILANEDESVEVYETIGWFRPTAWTITQDEQGESTYHRGRIEGVYDPHTDVTVMQVDAPWTSVRTKKRRLPFIVDVHGDIYAWATGEQIA